jgi:hypothetical protein
MIMKRSARAAGLWTSALWLAACGLESATAHEDQDQSITESPADDASEDDADASDDESEPELPALDADAPAEPEDASSPDREDASAPGDAAVEPDAGPAPEDAAVPRENRFFDGFDSFARGDVWGCEYTCPTASGGSTRFALRAGIPPDTEGSWSKIGYRPRRFTAGRFTVRFALSARPTQKVWWGIALWDTGPSADGSQFNEINFGYTTAHSFTNTQLYFESAKLGNAVSVKVDTGVDLYDGSFHTATLEYDATRVAFYFDGRLMETITDPAVIPTDPMKYIIGPRLVTGSAPLEQDFTETVDYTEIEW